MGLILNVIVSVLFFFNIFGNGDVKVDFHTNKRYHEPRSLNRNEVVEVSNMSDMTRFDTILSHILVPRVVGTESHTKVREYIMSQLKGLGYSVETEISEQKTPIGQRKFTNIIGRLNPKADRYLVLACHYDSKHMREGEFLGATDSAVPCAMILDLAHALHHRLDNYESSKLSLMMLFFDGEEAFVHWGPNDSIYGARSLAKKWSQNSYPRDSSETTHLDRIDLLVLLDLLGAPRPSFFSYFKDTEKWYLQLVSAEKRLDDEKQLRKSYNDIYFNKLHLSANIEDDHIPFIRKGVPCVHVIPTPFPHIWHTPEDNRNALDMDTIDNLNKIVRVFVLEYLEGSSRSTRSAESKGVDL